MVRTLAFLLAATFVFADTQTPQNFSGDFVIKVSYSYLLSKPEGYGVEAKKSGRSSSSSMAAVNAVATSNISKSMGRRSSSPACNTPRMICGIRTAFVLRYERYLVMYSGLLPHRLPSYHPQALMKPLLGISAYVAPIPKSATLSLSRLQRKFFDKPCLLNSCVEG
jgi:hypothetical protein